MDPNATWNGAVALALFRATSTRWRFEVRGFRRPNGTWGYGVRLADCQVRPHFRRRQVATRATP